MKPRLARFIKAPSVSLLILMASASVAFADPLDDAQAKLTSFVQRAGTVASLLLPGVAALVITVLAIKRALEKASGQEDAMARTGNQIMDVLKLTAIGTGASLLVAIAGSVLR